MWKKQCPALRSALRVETVKYEAEREKNDSLLKENKTTRDIGEMLHKQVDRLRGEVIEVLGREGY